MACPQYSFRKSSIATQVSGSVKSRACIEESILLDRCKSGDLHAWDTLIHRYERMISNFAYSLCHNREEAGDITSLVLLRLYSNLHRFDYRAGFSTWLFRIVRNTYCDLCVRSAYRRYITLDTDLHTAESASEHDLSDPAPSPESICLQQETQRLLVREIEHLPAYQRQILRMRYLEGKSYEEIGTATGLAVGTVKSRLSRARSMLRRRWQNQI